MSRSAKGLAGRELGGSRSFLLGLGLVIALGGGTAFASAVVAHRTAHAYPDYVRRANVGEVVINPGVWSTAIDAAIRNLVGVESVHSHTLLAASASDTTPMTPAEANDAEAWVQTVGSIDGRYVESDRPAVSRGRAPTGPHEVFVSDGYRAGLEQIQGRALDVGDTIDLAFWWNLIVDGGVAPDEVVAPIAVEQVRIAGFGVLPNEILPDELFPRQQLVVSADLAAKYSCLPTLRPDMTSAQATEASSPRTCSSQYWFYSLNLQPGVSVASIRDQFADVAASLNESELPEDLRAQGSIHFYIGQDRADLDEAVARTTRPAVAALWVFAAVAGAATVTIVGLMIARMVRRNAEAQGDLLALGATSWQRASWTALPLLGATVAGVAAAALVAIGLSPIGPLGSVRSVQPSPGFGVPVAVAAPAVLILVLASAIVIALITSRSSRLGPRPQRPGRRPTRGVARVVVRSRRPPAVTGILAATGSRDTRGDLAVLIGCVVAITAGVSAIVFGGNLSSAVSHPRSYGWPWDVSVLTGGGYGYMDTTAVEATLGRGDLAADVVDVSYFALDPSTYLGDRTAPVIFGFPNASDTELPILAGRDARAPGEAVLGSDTSEQLDIGLGDELTARSDVLGAIPIHVVGIGVLPAAGPFVADRTGLGTGAFVLVDADPNGSAGLLGLTLRAGVDRSTFVGRLGDVDSWDGQGAPVVHTTAVRPPEIINISDMRSAPMLLGGILVLSLGVGLSLSVSTSVRDRRRELAILRAIGFSNRDLHASVRWQAATVVAAGVIVGVPVGLVAGGFAWRRFAEQLGVVPTATVPAGWLAAYVGGTAVLAVIAAIPGSRAAARLAVVDVLRSA